jgi:hypothetical protein
MRKPISPVLHTSPWRETWLHTGTTVLFPLPYLNEVSILLHVGTNFFFFVVRVFKFISSNRSSGIIDSWFIWLCFLNCIVYVVSNGRVSE